MKRPDWCAAFIVALEVCDGKIAPAARFVGVSRQSVYHRRSVDEGFDRQVERALQGHRPVTLAELRSSLAR